VQTTAVSATLTATGSGSVTYAPELASLSFGASVLKTTASGAISANATVMTAILDALKKAGVHDVSTDSVSLTVRNNTAGTAIVGFQATNAVQGSVDVGAAIDAAVAAGPTTINGPSFSTTRDLESL
jgi:uncharacterized protein YggE